MHRRDFQLIADVIKDLQMAGVDQNYIARRFADKLKETNALFDRAKFLKACGVNDVQNV